MGVDGNTRHRADLHTLWFVKMTDALSALVRVNLIDLDTHVNGLVWTFGLAHVAVNTFVGNDQGHGMDYRASCP